MKSKRKFYSSVSPKGQITLPAAVRQELGIHPKDQVVIEIEDGVVRVMPATSRLVKHYQSVPTLNPPRTWKEMEEIVRDELAENAAREGLP